MYCVWLTEEPTVSQLAGGSVMILIDARARESSNTVIIRLRMIDSGLEKRDGSLPSIRL